jgi:hypothetical protein
VRRRDGRAVAQGAPWRIALGAAAVVVVAAAATPAWAFALDGHEVIEAAAYKRLLALDDVPGTGVSGRTLLASLIHRNILMAPRCFDLGRARGDCDAAARLDLPLGFWPVLGSGGPDLVIDRQLGQRGQCQHFMAPTADSLAPVDPRLGFPGALATTAYDRCVQIAGQVFDGILRHPLLSHWRLAGIYVLMHAVEDSFSAAHVLRDQDLRIRHLLSWTLIDWPRYLGHGELSFPPTTHHAVSDARDNDYLRQDARTPDGQACDSFHNPYAVPEACLTERALAAVDAVYDLLVLVYRLHAGPGAPQLSLFVPAAGQASGARSGWVSYLNEHFASAYAQPRLPDEPREAPARPDVFLGLHGTAGPQAWGIGPWGARLVFLRATVPFALGVTGRLAFRRDVEGDSVGAGAGISLLLPLVRRLTIGASPAGVSLFCERRSHSCSPDVGATLGLVLVPLGARGWVGAVGPEWSWTERTMGSAWFGIVLGWSNEVGPGKEVASVSSGDTWNPPRLKEVHSFRSARGTRVLFLATTAWASEDDAFVGGGLEWRLDRDRWNRRTGFVPGVQIEVDQGSLGGGTRGGGFAAAPLARLYLVADRLALTATPALVRFGVLTTGTLGVDVAARGGLAFEVGNIEVAVDSFPLSYLPSGRRELFPFTVRLGVLLD